MRFKIIVSLVVLMTGFIHAQNDVISTVSCSHNYPGENEEIIVRIEMDLREVPSPDNLLGGYTAQLSWDSTIFEFIEINEQNQGFTGEINVSDTSVGLISFNGVSTEGQAGIFDLYSFKFKAVGSHNQSCSFNLTYFSLSSANTFTDLLPRLSIQNSSAVITNDPMVIARITTQKKLANKGDDIALNLEVDTRPLLETDSLIKDILVEISWDYRLFWYNNSFTFKNNFTGTINTVDAQIGKLVISASNLSGKSGYFEVVELGFHVQADPNILGKFDTVFEELSTVNQVNLLPYLESESGILPVIEPSMSANSVVSRVLLSSSKPLKNEIVTAGVLFDLSQIQSEDSLLGSYSGSLTWDPSKLEYVSYSGNKNGFIGVVNESEAVYGQVLFNGANASGLSGIFDVIYFNFKVTGSPSTTDLVDLSFTDLSSAYTFNSLLSFLNIFDASIIIYDSFSQVVKSFGNLIGLPLIPENVFVKTVYPAAIQGTLFEYDGNYLPRDSLRIGKGYWLSFNRAQER
jgi:hypothetical protein